MVFEVTDEEVFELRQRSGRNEAIPCVEKQIKLDIH